MKSEKFVQIPGFSNFEWNGEICRNIKTQKPKARKTKNGKYQLVNDAGQNLDRSPEQLDELCFKNEIPMDLQNVPKSIMFRVNFLHHQGKTKEEIMELLSIDAKKVTDCRWHYDNKNYKSKIVKFLNSQS